MFFLHVFLGKVAIDELMRMCVIRRQDAKRETEQENIETVRLKLQTLWKVYRIFTYFARTVLVKYKVAKYNLHGLFTQKSKICFMHILQNLHIKFWTVKSSFRERKCVKCVN